MISQQTATDSLERLSSLKRFPANAGALKEIGRIIDEACDSDSDAVKAVGRILAGHDEWCGPATLREICGKIKHERLQSDEKARCKQARDGHECDCPGYLTALDQDRKTVSVYACPANFEPSINLPDYHYGMYACRKRQHLDSTDPQARDRMLVAELEKRPGWIAE